MSEIDNLEEIKIYPDRTLKGHGKKNMPPHWRGLPSVRAEVLHGRKVVEKTPPAPLRKAAKRATKTPEPAAPLPIGTVIVKSYDDLISALRARKTELRLSDGTIDALTGLTSGHTGKILGPSQVKLLGRVSMGLLLQALGLMLVVVEDPEQRALMQSRYVPRREKNVRDFNHAVNISIGLINRVKPVLNRQVGERLTLARKSIKPPTRRRIARQAARARWKFPRRKKLKVKNEEHTFPNPSLSQQDRQKRS